jgi:serine phosphatase RsbU (regulator of sigma subunit)
MASLVAVKGGNAGQQYTLQAERSSLGRNPDCAVVIAGTSVSREHAHILRVGDRFFIEDNKSRNGTFVNDQQIISRTPLRDNDRIRICDFVFRFQDPTSATPASALSDPLTKPLSGASTAVSAKGFAPIDDADDDSPSKPFRPEASISHLTSSVYIETQPADKLRLLLDIFNNISKTLELEPLLPQIVDNLFQMFKQADRGFIILCEDNRYIPKVVKTRRANTETTARFSRTIVRHCIETVQAFLSEDAGSDRKIGLSESIVDFKIRSVMCAPLWGQQDGLAFGVIQLDTQDRNKKFTQDDLNLLMGVARQASIALENVKLHHDLILREKLKRDAELARDVQRTFLPSIFPTVPGYEFFAHYEPAQDVGGDYYDFVELSAQRVLVLLGDVAGKGIPAALLMAKLSAEARFCALTVADPAAAISRLNVLLTKAGLIDRFVTLAAALLDPTTHTVTIVNAGHMSPLIYRHATTQLEDAISNEKSGLPLGVVDGFPYDSTQVTLQPGDCLLIYSDGVNEAMDVNNQAFDMKGIRNAVLSGPGSATAVGQRLVKAVKQHSARRSQHDDITLVCVSRSGGDDDDVTDDMLDMTPNPNSGPITDHLPGKTRPGAT